MFTLGQETEDDWWEVEALYDTCFAPGRTALSSYRLREDVPPVPELCVVARDEMGVMGGAIRYWPVQVGGAAVLLLGPVAVHPTAQGEGLGGALIRDTLARAVEAGHARVLLVGDAPYYRRFGFEQISGVFMPPPTNPDRILALNLYDHAWNGVRGEVERIS
ncbi:MAG: N-acetyltransferase [Pelagimonas sp.]